MDYATNNYNIPETNVEGQLAKKKNKLWAIILLSAAICLFLLVFLYVIMGLRYRGSFFPKTVINGIDASGMEPGELAQKILEKAENYSLVLDERNQHQEQILGDRIKLRVEVAVEKLEEIVREQNSVLWLFQSMGRKEYQAELNVSFDEALLSEEIRNLDCMDSGQVTAPEDAHEKYFKGTGYRIVPEVPGNKVKKKKLKMAVRETLSDLKDSLSLEKLGCYYDPKVSKSDEELKEKVRVLNQYTDMTVTYIFGEKKEILDGVQISKWIQDVQKGKVTVNEKKIKQYVGKLADTYDTVYKSRNFKTSYGPAVRIGQGDYGFKIDQEREAKTLKKIILSGKSREREPVYAQRGAEYGPKDYGDTYVELNLTTQHLFLYKKGKCILETDFVSGCLAKGNGTPCGIYAITYKQRDAVLKGADYRSEVSYWMPFNQGIGLHDANWRTKFGKDIYKNNGSHGCINLPPQKAKIIYETVEKGTPVICYTLTVPEQKKRTERK